MLKTSTRWTSHRVAHAIVVIALAASISACGGGGGGGGAAIVVPTTPPQKELLTQTKYAIQLVSEKDGSPVADDIAVTFTGSAAIVDLEGTSLNGKTVTTNTGAMLLGVTFAQAEASFTVSAANPQRGWSTVSRKVVGDPTLDGTKAIELRMFNIADAAAITADPAKAIASTSRTAVDLGSVGTVSSPPKVVTNTDGAAVEMGSAALSFQAGTRAIDPVTGAPVTVTGAVTVSSTMYSAADDDTFTSLPGGARPVVPVPGDPGAAPGVLQSVGFANFSVKDAAGKALTRFDKPLALSIDLPKTTLDATGNPVVPGSAIEIWSYDELLASWKYEKDGTVSEKSPADPFNYTVAFTTTHLSLWNMAFTGKTCTGLIILDRGTDKQGLQLIVTGTTGKPYKSVFSGVTESRVQLWNASIEKFNVEVKMYNKLVGSLASTSLCGGVVVPLTLPGASESGTITVASTESCADGSGARPLPNFSLQLESVDRPASRIGSSGEISQLDTEGAGATASFLKVPSGRYTVFGHYQGKNRTGLPVTVTTANTANLTFNLPRLVCQPLTGGG